MREIYFKPFEIAVKEGKTTALMSSFNRIGTVWAGGNRPLLTNVLKGEWGFRGTVVTDYDAGAYMDTNQMLSAGGDLMMNTLGKFPKNTGDAATVAAMRQGAKNILYMVANSHAMNGIEGKAQMATPSWVKVTIAIDVVVGVAILAGTALVVFRVLKMRKPTNA